MPMVHEAEGFDQSPEAPQASNSSPDGDLNPSQYLAKNVYPILEPAIVELLKAAFPADFREFVRRASIVAEESQLEEAKRLVEEKNAQGASEAGGEEPEDLEGGEEQKPTLPPPTPPQRKAAQTPVPNTSARPLPKSKLRPVLWLAQYLKERNKVNTAAREEERRQNALELARKPGEDIETVHENLIAGVKALLWPCSVYIATRDKITEKVPKPVDPEEEAAKQKAAEEEQEEQEQEQEQEGEEEGEDGEEKPPKEPEMMDVEVAILRYVATSHPNKETIHGRLLRLEDDGVSARSLQTREPLLVEDVAEEEALQWFAPAPEAKAGSFLAISLTRTPEDQEPYAVLSVDTLLDRRRLTDADVSMTLLLARAAEAVGHTVPVPPPPPPPEEPAAEEPADDGEAEEAEEEG